MFDTKIKQEEKDNDLFRNKLATFKDIDKVNDNFFKDIRMEKYKKYKPPFLILESFTLSMEAEIANELFYVPQHTREYEKFITTMCNCMDSSGNITTIDSMYLEIIE